MKAKAESPDEQPKKKTADKVVSKKALYFVPEHSVSVEAETPDDAVKKAKNLTESREEGDD